jgi:hypothetical protein
MARRDLVAASVLLLFAAVVAIESLRLLPLGVVRNPGPGFYPWWVSLTLCLLAVVLLVQSFSTSGAPSPAEERGQFLRVAGVLAVLGVYSLVLDTLGYPLATFAVVLFMLRVTEPHPWPVALGFAVLAAGGSYLLFAVWLAVPLPAGPFAR